MRPHTATASISARGSVARFGKTVVNVYRTRPSRFRADGEMFGEPVRIVVSDTADATDDTIRDALAAHGWMASQSYTNPDVYVLTAQR